MTDPKSRNGVSLFELLIAIVVLSILTAAIPSLITKLAAEKRDEADIADFWMEMRTLRSKVLKGGVPVITTFDIGNSTYDIYVDSNSDNTADPNELQPKSNVPNIKFGMATPAPSSLPTGVDNFSVVSISRKDGMIIDDNSTLSIASGHIYLKNPSKSQVGYCLTVVEGETEVQLFKWNGSKWYKF